MKTGNLASGRVRSGRKSKIVVDAYGRSPKGKRCFATRPGNRSTRISIVAGLLIGALLAPLWFTGMCNSAVFNEWFEKILLPELPKGAVVILDNARFHKSKRLRLIAKAAGVTLLFPLRAIKQ